ncbi:hypothetical protein [Halorubrum sp. Atlit-26R]|uniref:hypothetical protein n=1 Tax=Halorubrum sp. Atlit-26R TaxID=2282128 RepID=UPI0018F70D85|nr:hypothetical protein [Halorubrum sp. Atlit-26R]
MIDQELRRNLFRVGIIVVAFFGAIFVSVFLNSYALSGLFSLVAVAGVFLLLELQKAYSITMIVVGVLALAFAVLGYLNLSLVNMPVLYALLAVLGIVRGGQAYRATE